jgi:hypothetical protein
MYIQTRRAQATAAVILVLVAAGIKATPKGRATKEPDKKCPAVLWREPSDISSRDLFYGPGGKDHVPRGTFTFEREDMEGSNPKFDVIDQDGIHWRVKLGQEARPETAATRFAWAIGYFANEDYFVPMLHVEKMQRLRRGRQFVLSGNNVHDVRLKRHVKDEKKIGSWSWAKNPFTGTREWYGLRVLMAVLNNWDLKDNNNSVYLTHGDSPEEHYAVSDIGASFGPTGLDWMTKGQPAAYCKSKFIKKVSSDFVDFAAPSGPALNYYIDFPELGGRLALLWIGQHIPRADARWVGDLLARLSPAQIRAPFRAAGYSTDEAEQLSQTLERRIAELEKL